MTISYPRTFPTSPKPRKARIIARSIIGTTESIYTFSTQKQEHAGQRWEMDLEMPPMTKADAGQWIAFLVSLNGKQGTVLVPDPDRTAPQGVGTGTPLVDGASQSGAVLVTNGWTISTTAIMSAGDLIQVGNYSYMVLVDANSDGSGTATLDIWPDLRSSPANDAAITVNNCKTLMQLATNEMAWSTDELQHYGISLTFIEALPST